MDRRSFQMLRAIWLGVTLFSAAYAESPVPSQIHKTPEPHDESNPTYLGRCRTAVIVADDHHGWTLKVNGDVAWPAFNYHGVVNEWGSRIGPEGPFEWAEIRFGRDGNDGLQFDPPKAVFKYTERASASWCHAYRKSDNQPEDGDESMEDFEDPTYLGYCHLRSTRTSKGAWQLWVEGDPAWGNFYASVRYELWGSEEGPDGVFGGSEHAEGASADTFNRNHQHLKDPSHGHFKYVEKIDENFCHAFRRDHEKRNDVR